MPSKYDSSERDKEPRVKNTKRGNAHRIAKNFADQILMALDSWNSPKTDDFQSFLGINYEDAGEMKHDFPLYRRDELLHGINEFIKANFKIRKISNYYENDLDSVVKEQVEVSRGKFKTEISEAFVFCEKSELKFVVRIYFEGTVCTANFHYVPKDERKIVEVSRSMTFTLERESKLRGEKLEFNSKGRLLFLDYPKITWEDLILKESFKSDVILNLVLALENKEYFEKQKIPWRRGVLIGGPPGTGKTQLCRVLYNVLPATVILATTKAIYNEEQVKVLFEAARALKPTLVILEDLDFVGTSRDLAQNPILGELLNQLDGSAPNDGVFVLATSNRPELLDTALSNRPSRFDVKLELKFPEKPEREKLLELFFKDKDVETPPNLEYLAGKTDGLTGAYLKELVTYSCLLALSDKRVKVNNDDVEKSLCKLAMKDKNKMST